MNAELTAIPFPRRTIIRSDTTSFAPEEIPSTKGPAIGLAKNVWSRKPDTGSVHLTVEEIGGILFKKTGEETAYRIVWDIRLPRILAAAILGGALSVSGFLLQTFFSPIL